ncbi:MAG TPA: hypothetical protein PK891_06525 [Bacteroidales bacterium]|nr:hypothetical protein [Bacteroidales bacterium]
MIDERLYADLVELYSDNIKAYKEQNSGLIIETVRPLVIEDLGKLFDPKEIIDHAYIDRNYRNFTINPQITEMKIRNGVSYVEISPDISWERQVNNN